MNNAPNFSSLLDRPSDSAERPKPLPAGSYLCTVAGQPRFDKSAQKKTDFVEFSLKIVQALEDVDEDAIKEWAQKKDGTIRNLTEATIKATYYLTEDALWRLTEFLNHCGAGDESMSFKQRIAEAVNSQVVAVIGHRASQDGENFFAELKKTAAAE